jgi:hypothetical protein
MGRVHRLDDRRNRALSSVQPTNAPLRRVETRRLQRGPTGEMPRRLAHGWHERLVQAVRQNPLIATRPTFASLELARVSARPDVVLVGVGLCDHQGASRGVPFDLLGLLLPAEMVRRAVLATRLVVLIADEHALRSGISARAIDRQVDELGRVLVLLRRALGLKQMRSVRASQIHRDFAYDSLLQTVSRRSGRGDNEYMRRQLADVEYFHRLFGGALKVGWTVGGNLALDRQRDEVAFDTRFRQVVGDHVPFVYCKAGRTFLEGRPKASPYVVRNPQARLLLRSDEQLSPKLQQARIEASSGTINGVCRHVKLITRLYWQIAGRAARGDVQRRSALLLRDLFSASDPAVRHGSAPVTSSAQERGECTSDADQATAEPFV